MPTYNKYIISLTSIYNDIKYIEDINNISFIDNGNKINICYINSENLSIIKTIITLLDIKSKKKKLIIYKQIKDLEELDEKDIYLGLIYPNPNLQKKIDDLKLKPVFFTPKDKLPEIENRFNVINREDTDLQKKFHYELKLKYGWLLESYIYLTLSTERYRTYKLRMLLITSKDNENLKRGNNFRTLINNWYEHLLILRNIYQVNSNNLRNYPTVSDQFTNLGALDSKLKYYDDMKIFLHNKKLLNHKIIL